MGICAGRSLPIRVARALARRTALPLGRTRAPDVPVSCRYGAGRCRTKPPQRPGAGAVLRTRLARDHALSGSRRQFLSAALVGLTRKTDRPIAGGFIDDGHGPGHQLRDRAKFATAKRSVKIPIVIVGGGIAGLSSAWRLDKRGFRDFALLEMLNQAGGNARWGENEITP